MNGQRVGYVRVSTFEQNAERQLDGINPDRTFHAVATLFSDVPQHPQFPRGIGASGSDERD